MLTKAGIKTVQKKLQDVYKKAFEDIKTVMDKETIFNYPSFNDTFEIHTDVKESSP